MPPLTSRAPGHCRRRGVALMASAGSLAVALSGCATSQQSKEASAQVTAALTELRGATRSFRDLYVAEIERIRVDYANAAVARAVRLRVQEISASFQDSAWLQVFSDSGLITLSREIEEAQDAARGLVAGVSSIQLKTEQSGDSALASLREQQSSALGVSADRIRQLARTHSGTAVGRRMEEQAARLDRVAERSREIDPIMDSYLISILELGGMKADTRTNLRELEDLIEVLRATHSVINDWIATDVTVSGEAVGQLLLKHESELFPPAEPGSSGAGPSQEGGGR